MARRAGPGPADRWCLADGPAGVGRGRGRRPLPRHPGSSGHCRRVHGVVAIASNCEGWWGWGCHQPGSRFSIGLDWCCPRTPSARSARTLSPQVGVLRSSDPCGPSRYRPCQGVARRHGPRVRESRSGYGSDAGRMLWNRSGRRLLIVRRLPGRSGCTGGRKRGGSARRHGPSLPYAFCSRSNMRVP